MNIVIWKITETNNTNQFIKNEKIQILTIACSSKWITNIAVFRVTSVGIKNSLTIKHQNSKASCFSNKKVIKLYIKTSLKTIELIEVFKSHPSENSEYIKRLHEYERRNKWRKQENMRGIKGMLKGRWDKYYEFGDM